MPGILDIPTAGSFNDGEFSFSSSRFKANLRNTLSFQALPRVFGAFRYSGIGDSKSYYYHSGYTTWDRSFDLRVDILKEKSLIPAMTVGFQDIIGTGNFSAEYLVASKSIFNKLRATAGLGWGRLATQNQIVKNKERPSDGGSFGGLLRYNQLFRGNVGVFGGMEYMTPLDGLKAKVEYSSDNYQADQNFFSDTSNNSFSQNNKLNYGLDYTLNENLNVSSYYIHGNKLGLQVNISLNPNSTSAGDYLEPAPQPFYSLPYSEKLDMKIIWEKIITILKKEENINTIGYALEENEAILLIENNYYVSDAQAIGRSLRILSRYIPSNILNFTIVLNKLEIPISFISVNRNELSEIIDAPNAELLTKKISHIGSSPRQYQNITLQKNNINNKIDFTASPYYQIHLFDPDQPLYYDLGLKLTAASLLKPGLIVRGTVKEPILTTFGDISRGPKGSLPKVRTNIKNYLNETNSRIEELTVSSYFKLSDNIFGRLQTGYFEPMYAGLSSEILYFDSQKPLAFGAEINYVKPREYEQLLGFRTVTGMPKVNGHFSTYWDTGYYNYHAQLDYGKYLAGDKGSTVTVTRKFGNGWDFGGFFTLTDASFADFGEGSFDKGFFFKLPFNAFVPYETKYTLNERIRPILGDGGSKVNIKGRIYEMFSPQRKSNIEKSWARLWR